MAFDLASAKPVEGGFDLSSAKRVDGKRPAPEKPTEPAPEEQTGGLMQAIAEPAANMATGMIAKPVSDLAGLGAMAVDYVRGRGGIDPVAVKKRVQEALTYEPKTTVGKAVTEYNPVAIIGKGVDYVASGVGNVAKGDETNPWHVAVGNAIEETIKQLPQFAGMKLKEVTPELTQKIGAAMEEKSKDMMRRALKPSVTLPKGEADRAIDTLLKEGINVSKGGLAKLDTKISDINDKIDEKISSSTAYVNKNSAASNIKGALDKFKNQVNPGADIREIQGAWDEFLNHPVFNATADEGALLKAEVDRLSQAKIAALQDAGRFKTFEAQQRSLAHGETPRLSPDQPVNEPYMNIGATGGTAKSPSAYPVETQPRIPGRYTENIQRVPEGAAAAEEAMNVFKQRSKELESAQRAFDDWTVNRKDAITVQQAQAMKRGTYRALGDKAYGELKGASIEAQKTLARGLKDEIAKQVPEVRELNAKDSELLTALPLVERRVLLSANKNPAGLGWLSANPKAFAAWMADRSDLFKSLVARMLYSGGKKVPTSGASLPYAAGAVQIDAQNAAAKRRAEAAMAYGMEGRADGGPVNAGQPYVVGERGPEVIVPHQSGTVVPNIVEMGGGKYAVGPDLRDYMTMPFMADPAKPDNWREDGSLKGGGFLGSLKTPDVRTATEYSVGVNINGKDIDVPSLVPTLTRAEVQQTLAAAANGKFPPQSVIDKAAEFAKQRMMSGLSVFAQ